MGGWRLIDTQKLWQRDLSKLQNQWPNEAVIRKFSCYTVLIRNAVKC